jgi:hypothetical protein
VFHCRDHPPEHIGGERTVGLGFDPPLDTLTGSVASSAFEGGFQKWDVWFPDRRFRNLNQIQAWFRPDLHSPRRIWPAWQVNGCCTKIAVKEL